MKKTYSKPQLSMLGLDSDGSLLTLSVQGDYRDGVTLGAPGLYRRNSDGDIYEDEDEEDDEEW